MTPWKHSEATVRKWGGHASDYIEIHNWLDETSNTPVTGDTVLLDIILLGFSGRSKNSVMCSQTLTEEMSRSKWS